MARANPSDANNTPAQNSSDKASAGDKPTASLSPDATASGSQGGDTGDNGEITIYPLRSYLDGTDIRRAGGAGYKSPKHDAVSLIAAGLATDKNPKV